MTTNAGFWLVESNVENSEKKISAHIVGLIKKKRSKIASRQISMKHVNRPFIWHNYEWYTTNEVEIRPICCLVKNRDHSYSDCLGRLLIGNIERLYLGYSNIASSISTRREHYFSYAYQSHVKKVVLT